MRLEELCDAFLEDWPNAAFGPGHIVLDDYNLDYTSIEWCRRLTVASLTGDTQLISGEDVEMLGELRFYEDHSRAELVATRIFLTGLLKLPREEG